MAPLGFLTNVPMQIFIASERVIQLQLQLQLFLNYHANKQTTMYDPEPALPS